VCPYPENRPAFERQSRANRGEVLERLEHLYPRCVCNRW
jgi:hypothetical protein